MEEARKPRFMQHRFQLFYSGQLTEFAHTRVHPGKPTSKDEPKQPQQKNALSTQKDL